MHVAELGALRVAIWGLGREGRAAIKLLRKHHPQLPLLVLNDAADSRPLDEAVRGIQYAFGADEILRAV